SQIPHPVSRISYPVIFGSAFAFLLSEIFQTPLIALDIPLLSTIVIFVLWFVTFRFLYYYLSTGILTTCPTASFRRADILRIGLFAGLLAFLIHSLADFNFYVQGLSMGVWFIGAVLLSTAKPSVSLSFLKKQEYRVISILIGLIVVLLCFVTVRLMKYESFLEQGKIMIRCNDRKERLTGVDYLGKSSASNIFSADVSLELAWAMHNIYGSVELHEFRRTPLPLCLERIALAISLNPLAPMLYNHQGRLYLEHAEQERKKGNKKLADIYEQRAKRSFRMVRELYPTWKQRD
ncbi:MAG: hypothetical protein AB1599_09080, partial [Planctomycetota bacterium]